jgi:iron complex outermembrane receptor protein
MLFLNRSAELEFKNMDELNYNPERSYTSNDLTLKNPTVKMQGKMRYELSGQ